MSRLHGVTVTNSMLGNDIIESLDRQHALGIRHLDLKDRIFGKPVSDLSDAEAHTLADAVAARNMRVHCLSTVLFDDDAAKGADHFRAEHVGRIGRVVELARILKPNWVRLMAAQSSTRSSGQPLLEHLAQIPWLIPAYQEAIAQVHRAGFATIVENEIHDGILRNPDDVASFFGQLAGAGAVGFTWDIQNMWETGEFPSLDVYRRLKPYINYVHVKGGVMRPGESILWKARLRDASWPVAELLDAIAEDNISPVICVNPCHGTTPSQGYDEEAAAVDDIQFVQEVLAKHD